MSSQLSSNEQTAGVGFDWRGQVSEHPMAFSVGALAAGIIIGYSLGGALGGGAEDEAQGGGRGVIAANRAQQTSYASGTEDWPLDEGAGKPGLIEKFKNTQAFDRLQEELSSLGDRLLKELSRAGREVVLPAMTAKLKSLLGAEDAPDEQPENARAAAPSSAP